ncbi:MAG: VCBS repeat-containing protein, partial [Planctomycetes bacterium]|nr:VCBS repeat-containing protein [Planctomycetota bacterium]
MLPARSFIIHSRLLRFFFCCFFFAGSSRQVAAGDPQFLDVTQRTGIDFIHSCGSREKARIYEVNGSGVALFDCDQDGDLDIYFVNASGGKEAVPRAVNALYRNNGDWSFSNITARSGTGDPGWGSGAAVADIDNDGLLELYVTNRGPNVLYRNTGGGRFKRVEESGAEVPVWSTSASFADFDSDGLVDLYVANYLRIDDSALGRNCEYKGLSIFCGPGGMEPEADVLLKNEGGGRFRDVSRAWGLNKAPASYGLGTLVVDIGRDGRPDIIVANDTRENFCFLNNPRGGFDEAAIF